MGEAVENVVRHAFCSCCAQQKPGRHKVCGDAFKSEGKRPAFAGSEEDMNPGLHDPGPRKSGKQPPQGTLCLAFINCT